MLLKERLWALGTLEGFFTPYSPQVRLKVCVLGEELRAVVTFKRLYSCVGSQVLVEIRRAMETLRAQIALVGSFVRVNSPVSLQATSLGEGLGTIGALVTVFLGAVLASTLVRGR